VLLALWVRLDGSMLCLQHMQVPSLLQHTTSSLHTSVPVAYTLCLYPMPRAAGCGSALSCCQDSMTFSRCAFSSALRGLPWRGERRGGTFLLPAFPRGFACITTHICLRLKRRRGVAPVPTFQDLVPALWLDGGMRGLGWNVLSVAITHMALVLSLSVLRTAATAWRLYGFSRVVLLARFRRLRTRTATVRERYPLNFQTCVRDLRCMQDGVYHPASTWTATTCVAVPRRAQLPNNVSYAAFSIRWVSSDDVRRVPSLWRATLTPT
jgi:hypothetical protein